MGVEAFRQDFAKILGDDAEYLRVMPLGKNPLGSFKKGKPNRLKHVPLDGNFGVIPTNRLVILDIDAHHAGASMEGQILAFSQILGVDLESTFSVDTPNEGRHYYLRIPRRRDVLNIPKTTLRSASAAINELLGYDLVIDADLRSQAANAYVLGPSSSIPEGRYTAINWNKIQTISEQGYKNLEFLREESTKKDPTIAKAPKVIDLWKSDPIVVDRKNIYSTPPPKKIITRLNTNMNARGFSTYHQKRAYLKAALNCCYSTEAIAIVCADLNVDMDSSTNNKLTRFNLYKDLNRFNPTDTYHGAYCPQRKEQARKDKVWEPATTEALIEKTKERIRKRRERTPSQYSAGDFRVVDTKKVYKYLMEQTNRTVPTTQIRNAMFIVENMIQPLSNVGVGRYLLNNKFIVENSHMSGSQVTAALRVLRSANVLRIDEKQHTGATTVYRLFPHFYDRKLTMFLRKTWGNNVLQGEFDEHKPALLWSVRSASFVFVYSGQAAHTNRAVQYLAEQQMESVAYNDTNELALLVARSYLKFERKWLDENSFVLVSHSEFSRPKESLPKETIEVLNDVADSLVESLQRPDRVEWASQNAPFSRPGLRGHPVGVGSSPLEVAHPKALGRGGGEPLGDDPPPQSNNTSALVP